MSYYARNLGPDGPSVGQEVWAVGQYGQLLPLTIDSNTNCLRLLGLESQSSYHQSINPDKMVMNAVGFLRIP